MSAGDRQIKLMYFAWVREKMGRAEEIVIYPEGVETVAELITWLKTRGPEYQNAFERAEVIRAAIDKTHANATSEIGTAREIAFFPPVTGG